MAVIGIDMETALPLALPEDVPLPDGEGAEFEPPAVALPLTVLDAPLALGATLGGMTFAGLT